MVLALFEENQRRKDFLPLLFERVPDKPYVIQPLAAFRGEGVFTFALRADPPSQPKVALFVNFGNPAMVLALFVFDQQSIPLVPGNPETVGDLYADALNKLIKPNLRADKLYLLQEPLRVEQLSFTLVLLELPDDIDKLVIVLLKCVQHVCDSIKLLRFDRVIKAVTVYSGE